MSMAFGSCNSSGRWDGVPVHESEDVITNLLEFSFHFRDVFLRVRRVLLVVLLSSLCASWSSLLAISDADWASFSALTIFSIATSISCFRSSASFAAIDLASSAICICLLRQPSILVLLPCVDDFQTLFSSYVSACSWHCSSVLFLHPIACLIEAGGMISRIS